MAILLCIGMLTGTTTPLVAEEAEQSEDFVVTQSDTYADEEIGFLVPVEQQTEVPEGYIGIYTAEDLDNVRNGLSANYILMNDIDLSEYDSWVPIGSYTNAFYGTLDGNGHRIVVTQPALFSKVQYSTICNVEINCLYFFNDNETMLISGLTLQSEGTSFDNVVCKGIIDVEYSQYSNRARELSIGGIVAESESNKFTSCNNLVDINVKVSTKLNFLDVYVGGIVGHDEGSNYNNMHNSGEINVYGVVANTDIRDFKVYVGGVVGYEYYTQLTKCINYGDIEVTSNYADVGGLVGSLSAIKGNWKTTNSINQSRNNGDISIEKIDKNGFWTCNTGGIIGSSIGSSDAHNDIFSCCNNGIIHSLRIAGGIVGFSQYSNIIKCENYNEINCIACCSDKAIPDTTSKGVGEANAAGIISVSYITGSDNIIKCSNFGDIYAFSESGSSYAGGILSNSSSVQVDCCFNTGDVKSESYCYSAFASGIAALTPGIISNCYNNGRITANCLSENKDSIVSASGITSDDFYGSSTSILYNTYNTGEINVYSQNEYKYIGGIIGYSIGSSRKPEKKLTYCYTNKELEIVSPNFLSDPISYSIDDCAVLSDTEMQSASSFVGFDFDTVWEIGVTDGYPYPTLRNNPHSGGNILKCPTLTVYPGSASTQTHFEWYKAEAPDAVKFYLEVCDVVDDVYPITVTASDATMYTVTMPQEPGSYTATLYALYEDGSRIKGNTVAYTVAGEIENPVYGKTYAQTTLKKLELDSIPEDSVIYNNPPYLAFSGQYTGVFHMTDGDTDTKVSFKYLTENGYIKIKPDSKGLYPADTFGGVIEEFQIKVNDDGTLRISACIPLFTDGVENTMGWTCWGDCFAATNLSGTANVICNNPTDYAGNYRSFTVRFASMPTSAYLQFDNQHDASKWLEEDYCASNVLFRIDLDEIVDNNEQLIYTTEFRIHSEGLASENYMRKVRVVAEYTGGKSVSEAHSFQVKPIPEREENNTIGCPYEQTSSPEESVDKPAILNVTNTAGKGEHRILSVVNYDSDAAAAPFFWWKADCGTFYKISDDFKKVGFIPNGSGTVTVYMGDGLGYVTSYALTIEN